MFRSLLFTLSLLAADFALAQAPQARVCIEPHNRCFATLRQALVAVADNETITLKPGLYKGDVGVLRASGVTLRSASGSERAVLDAHGAHAEGKAILVVRGHRATIEGIEFRNAAVPSKNGAGIRHEGADLIVRNCRFQDNEMGILGGEDGHTQLLDSEFSRSARTEDPRLPIAGLPSHNIYIGNVKRLTVRGVWSHSTEHGHPLKSRAQKNDVQASYFSTRHSNGSYEVEFPSAGGVIFRGNIVEQGVKSANYTMFAYGLEYERLPNPGPHGLVIEHNTFINHLLLAGTMLDIHDRVPREVDHIAANVWIGPGKPRTPYAKNFALRASDLTHYTHCDFRLDTALPDSAPPTQGPEFEYIHPAQHRPRSDRTPGALSRKNELFGAKCP